MAVNVNSENNLNDNSNKDRSWFWKKIGFWFVPVRSGTLGPEEWAKNPQNVADRKDPADAAVVCIVVGTNAGV